MLIITAIPPLEILNREIPINRILCIITDIIVFALIIYVTHRPVMKVKLNKMGDFNLPAKLKLNFTTVEKKPGDVVLCRNKDTKQDIIIPCKDRFLHMLVLGPTGSGKTSQIILPLLNQDLQNKDAGVTVIEPKGDLAEKAYAMAQLYGRKAIYFNPILESCPTFNPLYGKEEDVIENIVTAFKMLNTDSAQYFQDMNEQLLRNALKVLKMATVGGAKAMGLDNADVLEVNKLADIIMINLHLPNMQPLNNIAKNIVYSGSKQNIMMTMVDGKILYKDGEFYINEDVEDLYRRCQEITDRIKKECLEK
jgi:hypothetical protein